MENYDKIYKIPCISDSTGVDYLTDFKEYKFRRLTTRKDNLSGNQLYVKIRDSRNIGVTYVPVVVKKIDDEFEDIVLKEKLDLDMTKLSTHEKTSAKCTVWRKKQLPRDRRPSLYPCTFTGLFYTSDISLLSVKQYFGSLSKSQLEDYCEGIDELKHLVYRVYIETKTYVQESDIRSAALEKRKQSEIDNVISLIESLPARVKSDKKQGNKE